MPEYIPSRPVVNVPSLFDRKRLLFPPPGLFSFARYALIYYLRYLASVRRRPMSRVLLPDYMCHEVANALRAHGYEPVYYSLEEDFDVSLQALEDILRQSGRCDAILVGHFHGRICRNLAQVTTLCNSRDIAVIEDCVHLPFPYRTTFETVSSDVKLFTLRKVYPVPHGAVAVLREGQDEFAGFVAGAIRRKCGPGAMDALVWAVKQAAKKYLLATGTGYAMDYRDISQDPLRTFNFASPLLDRLLSIRNFGDSVERRRRNYRQYMEYQPVFERWGRVLHFDLARDVPYSLVIFLEERFDALTFVKVLMRMGIPAVLGLAIDPVVLNALPVKHRYNQILTLPIHQDIHPRHIAYIADVLSRYDRLAA